MKKFLVFLGLFVAFLSSILFAEKLIVVTDAWAPYVYEEENTAKGFDYEVMMKVFEKMGDTVEFKFYPWKRCIKMIEDGEAAAILDISKNDERLKTMYFPKEKISDSASVLFHLKAKPYTVT